ncbi:MAG: hypothetical protein ACYDC1_06640 [Limisphaerales bacterium]
MTKLPHLRLWVTGVVALAFMAWVATVVDWRELSVEQRLTVPVPTARQEPSDPFVVPPALKIAGALSAWRPGANGTSRADPFAYVRPSPAAEGTADLAGPDVGLWALTGISLAGDRAFAVVNRTVVAVGDEVGSCRVERIGRDEVVLAGPRGPVRLRLERGAVAEDNAPLAALVEADDSSGGGRLRGSAGPARVRESP